MRYKKFKQKVVKQEDRLLSKYLIRPFSTRLSWTILKVYPRVTPNQMTILAFCVGLIGSSSLFYTKNSFEILIASLILFLWHIFDHADGEIARYKNMKTPTGFFLEITFDFLIVAIVPVGVSFYLYRQFTKIYLLLLGFVDCVSILFYEFVIANYSWTFYKFNTNYINRKLIFTDTLLVKKFGGGTLLVNSYTIKLGKIVARIGYLLIYSGHMVLLLITSSFIDCLFKKEIVLWNQQITGLRIFPLPYLLFIPISISSVIIQYIILKTKLELRE